MKRPHALILAGGEAKRWAGADKGLLVWQDRTLVEHVIDRIINQVSGITLSCNRNLGSYQTIVEEKLHARMEQPFPYLISDEKLPRRGPLSGIYECLSSINETTSSDNQSERRQNGETLFICCCDTPLLPLNLVGQLQQRIEQTDASAVFPQSQHNKYWLNVLVEIEPAFHALQLLLEQSVEAHQFSIKKWLDLLDYQSITVNDELAFSNLNDASSLEKLERH